MAKRSGKHAVTSAQIDKILADLENERIKQPMRGMVGKDAVKHVAKQQKAQVDKRKAKEAATKRYHARQKKAGVTAEGQRVIDLARAKGIKGFKYDDLDPKKGGAQQALRTIVNMDADSEYLGKPRKKDDSFLVDTLNFLGRPMFATAEAVNDNQEKFYQERHKGKGMLSALGSGFKAGFGGWGEGISGKKKTTFSKVIQEVADNRLANRKGIGAARSGEVKAKVNPFLKHGLGLTLDIFGDPTTYIGVGLVTKAAQAGKILKADDAVEALNKTADVQKRILNSGADKVKKSELDEIMAVSRAPVEAIRRHEKKALAALTPEARILYDAIKAERKTGPKFKRKGAGETAHMGKVVRKGGEGQTDIKVKDALETLGATASRQHFDKVYQDYLKNAKGYINPETLAKVKAKGPMSSITEAFVKSNARIEKEARAVARKAQIDGKMTPKELQADLLAATQRNLSADVAKQLKVRVGPKEFGVAGTEFAHKLASKVRETKHVDKTAEWWNKHFRASAGVNPQLQYARKAVEGGEQSVIRAHLTAHQSVWNPVSAAGAGKAVMSAWRSPNAVSTTVKGGVHPTMGPVDDVVAHFDEQVTNLQRTLNDLEDFQPKELAAWIKDPKMQLPSRPDGWLFNQKTGKIYRPDNGEADDWLIQYLKRNDKIDDPGKALFQLHAAVEHMQTVRTTNRTAVEMFGVAKRKDPTLTTGHTGSKDLGTMTGQALKKAGWREAKVPGAEGHLFHPDIAEGLEKVNTIMTNRITTDEFLKGMDAATQVFKGVVTRYNPSFHVRTLMSEMMLSYIGGVRNPAKSAKIAAQILRGRNQEFLGDNAAIAGLVQGDRRLTEAANVLTGADRMARQAPTPPVGNQVALRNLPFKDRSSLTYDEMWGLFKNSGLKSGFASTDIAENVSSVGRTNMAGKVNQKVQGVTESVEDFGRMMHFVDALQHSKHKTLDEAVADAAQTVLKYHLDYTAVTRTEQTWMTRVAPFYKWVRLSTPMIMESLAHNPGKAMVIPKTMAAYSEAAGYDVNGYGIAPGGADALTPEWLREAGALPMGQMFGVNQFFNPAQTVPIYSMLEQTNRNPAANITPLIKSPMEYALNKTTFGAPVRDNKQQQLNFLLSQAPQAGAAGRGLGVTSSDVDPRQQLLSFLANPGYQPVTKSRVEGEAQRERQAAVAHRKKLMQELGIEKMP